MTYSLRELGKRIEPTKFYFLSPKFFKTLNNTVQHHQYWKPDGLWFACGNDWIRFMLENDFQQDAYDYLYELKIDTTNVLVIKSFSALEKFNKEYSYKVQTSFAAFDVVTGKGKEITETYSYIDWTAVAKKYNGIIICPSFLDKIWKLTESKPSTINKYFWYSLWDVASGVIWKQDAFQSAKMIYKKKRKSGKWEQINKS